MTASRFAEAPVVRSKLTELDKADLAAFASKVKSDLAVSRETYASPGQARAPKGTIIGGQWIETAKGLWDRLTGMSPSVTPPGEAPPGEAQLVEHVERMQRPVLSEAEIQDLRNSSITGPHINEFGEFSLQRQQEQEKIVNNFLEGVEPAAEGEAEAFFNGGGPASGKGSFTNGRVDVGYPTTREVDDMTGEMDFAGMPKPGAVLIDPDAVKMQISEVKEYRKKQRAHGVLDDPHADGGDWPGQSHEESSYIAKMIFMEAQRRNLNIVYDGTGTKIIPKAKEALANGYKNVHANYMYVEPATAMPAAIERAGRIGRNVSPKMQAGQYVDMPDAFVKGADSGIFKTFNLFDRNGVAQGKPVPKIFELNADGTHHVLDQAAYDRFMSSKNRVPDV